MKSLRNKVIMSAIVLAFALVATIGSTYAWFTVSSTVSVSSLTLNVQAGESLLIKVDDNYTRYYYNALGQYVDDIIPVDGSATYVWTDATPDTWTNDSGLTTFILDGSYNLVNQSGGAIEIYAWDIATNLAGVTGNLYTASTYKTTLVNSDFTGTTKYGSIASFVMSPVTSGAGETTVTNYASLNSEALRYYSDLVNRTLAAGTLNTTTLDIGAYISLDFWVMSQTSNHTIDVSAFNVTASNPIGAQDAVANAVNIAVRDVYTVNSYIFAQNPDFGFVFSSGMTGFDSVTSTNNSIPAGTITTLTGLLSTVGTTTVASLIADTPTKINVKIWIEGWDAQATNSILGAQFSVSFSFYING